MTLLRTLLFSLALSGGGAAFAQPAAPAATTIEEHAEERDLWKKLPVLRPTPPTTQTLELAQKLLELERRGQTDEAVARRAAAAAGRLFKSPPGLDDAMVQAALENPELIRASRARSAEVYARNYTDEELQLLIALISDPLGQTIYRKRLAAAGGRPTYTSEEQAWIDEHEGGEIGRSIQEKKVQVAMTVSLASLEFSSEIGRRAAQIYCERNTCSDEAKRRIAAGR